MKFEKNKDSSPKHRGLLQPHTNGGEKRKTIFNPQTEDKAKEVS